MPEMYIGELSDQEVMAADLVISIRGDKAMIHKDREFSADELTIDELIERLKVHKEGL